MADHATPRIAPLDDGTGDVDVSEIAARPAPAPAPITDKDVQEYREQDRFLPVTLSIVPSYSSPY